MCGRLSNTAKPESYKREFKVGKLNPAILKLRYTIAPSQIIEVIREEEQERAILQLKWGLVPSWAKDDSIGSKMINARAETLSEKPSFKNAFRSRRCIIPASGFYEWQKTSRGAKQPFYFYLKEKEVFGFAGLFEEWLDRQTGELIETCTIITTEANEVLQPIHDRMPVILKAESYDQWLDEKEKDTERLQSVLVPYNAKEMASHTVSKTVNSPAYDSPELIINSK